MLYDAVKLGTIPVLPGPWLNWFRKIIEKYFGMGLGLEKLGTTGLNDTNCQTIITIWGKRFPIKKLSSQSSHLDLFKKYRCNEYSTIL